MLTKGEELSTAETAAESSFFRINGQRTVYFKIVTIIFQNLLIFGHLCAIIKVYKYPNIDGGFHGRES